MKRRLGIIIAAKLFLAISIIGSVTPFLSTQTAIAAGPFVTTWKADKTIRIPTAPSATYDYFVDWGDGNTDSGVTGSISHEYATAGTYTVSISGQFPRILFKGSPERSKIQSVDAWGSIQWSSMVDAFVSARNLQILATDAPDLSNVTSLSGMFKEASAMNSPIGHWNVSQVQSIANMFEGATSFNQDLSNWDTSNMRMFVATFNRATSFNQNINSWDMSKALSTNSMFARAESFDQPLNLWDLGTVLDMRGMFNNAFSFNQDVSSWNIEAVNRMESIFRNAINFQQDVSTWDFSGVQYANHMFSGTRLSGVNYDKLLVALSETNLQTGVEFDAGTSTYCNAEAARNILTNDKGWTVSDKGRDTSSCSGQDIQFETGVAATVLENAPTPTAIGNFVTIPSDQQGFTYSFCSDQTADTQFFSLDGITLVADTSFDFESPLDSNGDNVYEICIRSSGPGGFELQRTLSVAVVDDQNEPEPGEENPDTGQSGGGQTDPQVLAANTDPTSDAQVLAAEDEEEAKALAASGVAILGGMLTGIVIMLTTTYFSRKPIVQEL